MDVSLAPRPAGAEPDYRRLLELVHAIVWRADARTFQTTFASRDVEEFLGYPREAWTDQPDFWVRHLHPDDRDRVLALSEEAAREGRTHDFEYRMIGADGAVVWLRNIVTVVMTDGEPIELVGVTVPIGERKQAELEAAQLRDELGRVTRAAALGELSTLLAHELNQPLGAIATNAETGLLQLRLGRVDVAALLVILEEIRCDANRGGAVVHGLHRLLRRGGGVRRPLDVARIVGDVINVLRPLLFAKGIDVVTDIPQGLPPIEGDAVQLQQVILNLVLNAIDAMAAAEQRQRRVRISAHPLGRFVEIGVADTGPGVSPDMLPRLFEPLVTTKPQGIGVGLAMCRRIIDSHGGEIDGANNPDGGATFRFTVKAAQADAGAAAG